MEGVSEMKNKDQSVLRLYLSCSVIIYLLIPVLFFFNFLDNNVFSSALFIYLVFVVNGLVSFFILFDNLSN